MGNETNAVSINDITYSPAFQMEEKFVKGWQSLLSTHYNTKANIKCLCLGRGDKLLAIKSYTTSNSYGLSKYSLSGTQHNPLCKYYAPNPDKCGLYGYTDGVLKELDQGNIGIKLSIGLSDKEPSDLPLSNAYIEKVPKPGKNQTAISLLGLLHWLWEDSSVNYWHKNFRGKRSWLNVSKMLRDSGKKLRVGRKKVSDHLVVANATDKQLLEGSIKKNNRLIIVAPISSHQEYKIVCEEYKGLPYLNIKADVWDNRIKKYPHEAKWLKQTTNDRSGHVVLIAFTTPIKEVSSVKNKTYKVDVIDFALMYVTDEWIPVASSYEHQLADILVAKDRCFTKPLRYDADESVFFPDFLLKDIGDSDYPLEVFGMNSTAYLAQKELKTTWYNKNYGDAGWWKWDALKDSIPSLPVDQ